MNKDQLKKKYLAGLAVVSFLAAWSGATEASFLITHSGSTDPFSEGFGVWHTGISDSPERRFSRRVA